MVLQISRRGLPLSLNNFQLIATLSKPGIVTMVGHSFQNYDRVYAGSSAAYTTIKIAYIRVFKWPHICVNLIAGICEINAQIYASYKGPYILVLKCAYMR